MSKQDSQHIDLEREPPSTRKKHVARRLGLRLYWRPFPWDKARNLTFHTKWYGTKEGREQAKRRYAKSDFYVRTEEVER